MTTTSITDAVVLHADEGTGLTDNTTDASFDSAVIQALQATGTGVPWHTLDISNLDTTAETVDVGPGLAWVAMQSGVSLQSAADETYDVDVDAGTTPLFAVYLPSTTTVALDADTSADLRLVIDPTQPDTVSVEHNTTPTDPALVIGSADSGSGGTATTANVGPIRGSHDELTGIASDDHHVKTSSASELSDVSADSVADAHHVKTSSASELSDVSPDSVTDAHHARPESISVSLGGSPPDATSYTDGDVVEDGDNPESLWYVYDASVSSGVRRIDPGTETTPTPAWLSTLNGADLQNAASGEAPVSNGDGTFSMAAAGGFASITSYSSAATLSDREAALGDASGGAITLTLPSPAAHVEVVVKKTDSTTNAVTVATPGSETIDGQSSLSITNQYASRAIISDGSNYFVI